MKILMYNIVTGDILITQAKHEGRVYQSYLNKGYTAIGKISGFNIVVGKLINNENINLNKSLK